ncbi:MAG: hypothetical protein ACOWWM_04950 [Desulfobacterales bacterium]
MEKLVIEDFPYLADWKKRGLDKFPDIPFSEYLRAWIEVCKPTAGDLKSLLTRTSGALANKKKPIIQQVLDEFDLADLRKLQDKAERSTSEDIFRKEIEREFSKRFLINQRGGKTFKRDYEIQILKSLHIELQAAIKTVRKGLGIPTYKNPTYTNWAEDYSTDIEDFFPNVDQLFQVEELSLLTNDPSVSDTSLRLLLRRLQKIDGHRYRITIETFRENLRKVQPIDLPKFFQD